MSSKLRVSTGQHSDKGRKETNQDSHGIRVPEEPLLSLKGVCVAIADGISSSDLSQEASETAIVSFLEDYYCTSEAWSVKSSGEHVLTATNSWLHSQTQHSQFRYEKDKGYVCTFSALIIKSTTAHIFHVGDTRVYRLGTDGLEQLTEDHRQWLSEESSYLSRALGVNAKLDLDYHSLQIEVGSTFVLASDGVYEYASEETIIKAIEENESDLDAAAESIVKAAYEKGSKDNLTVQILRVDGLPDKSAAEVIQKLSDLPFPPTLEARMSFDGYTITREIHATSRSHVYLAMDDESQTEVVIKTPATEHREDAAYLERFVLEEWIARRINNAHVLKPCPQTRGRGYLYVASEYIEGQTLRQWMTDNPKPEVETVRGLIEQIAKGLRAFHRLEMLHQDIRPENIMIDHAGTAKIIDFGSARVAGIVEIETQLQQPNILGTAQYTAPEYFLGEYGSSASDVFSLGVIAYEMLSAKLPYGSLVSRARTRRAQNNLVYGSVLDEDREIPAWLDDTIKKAVHPDPLKRYSELSEFTYDLRNPNKTFLRRTRAPLIERNPAAFWKGVSALLAAVIVILLAKLV